MEKSSKKRHLKIGRRTQGGNVRDAGEGILGKRRDNRIYKTAREKRELIRRSPGTPLATGRVF